MRRDHRPYFLKRAHLKLQQAYTRHFLAPQLDFLAPGATIIQPWYVEVFGSPVRIGGHANILCTRDKPVRLTVWPEVEGKGGIEVGDCCLICPGVRISSAEQVRIGRNTMLASQAYITDADWHGVYDRIGTIGSTREVSIGENVWIGDSAIVCKGVAIGDNAIIGAGSVVVRSIPANTVAAGNPARVVKELDPEAAYTRRSDWFSDPARLAAAIDAIDRKNLEKNTFFHWLRTVLAPRHAD